MPHTIPRTRLDSITETDSGSGWRRLLSTFSSSSSSSHRSLERLTSRDITSRDVTSRDVTSPDISACDAITTSCDSCHDKSGDGLATSRRGMSVSLGTGLPSAGLVTANGEQQNKIYIQKF